jgi:hypothetical protein
MVTFFFKISNELKRIFFEWCHLKKEEELFKKFLNFKYI